MYKVSIIIGEDLWLLEKKFLLLETHEFWITNYLCIDRDLASSYYFRLHKYDSDCMTIVILCILQTHEFTAPLCTILYSLLLIMILLSRTLHHPNLLALLGTVTTPHSLILVTNYVNGQIYIHVYLAREKRYICR